MLHTSPRAVYGPRQQPPRDLITKIGRSPKTPATLHRPAYGIDSVTGLILSNVTAPLYLHASLRGKALVWDELLASLPEEAFRGPSLDLGCGRGMVALKTAEYKKRIAEKLADDSTVAPAFAVDVFNKTDQTGNSPVATYQNMAAAGVLEHVVLHSANFTERLPFDDAVFSLITASLSVHNAPKIGRESALREMWRICAPGGRVVLVDLFLHFGQYEEVIREAGFEDVEVRGAGIRLLYGVLPCKILMARKPSH